MTSFLTVLTVMQAFAMRFLTAGDDLLKDIFDGFTTVSDKIISFFTTMFSNVVGMIWVTGTGLTSFGKLIIIPTAFGLFWLVFRWIRSLLNI